MKLSRNSWHSKFYAFFTGSYPKHTNLCPYFWSLMLCIITSPLLILFAWPTYLPYARTHFKNEELFSIRIVFGFAAQLLVVIAVLLTILVFLNPIPALATIVTVAITILPTWYLVNRKSKVKKKEPNIFIEFIKAKYNNYCPQITWKD